MLSVHAFVLISWYSVASRTNRISWYPRAAESLTRWPYALTEMWIDFHKRRQHWSILETSKYYSNNHLHTAFRVKLPTLISLLEVKAAWGIQKIQTRTFIATLQSTYNRTWEFLSERSICSSRMYTLELLAISCVRKWLFWGKLPLNWVNRLRAKLLYRGSNF